MLSLVCPAVVAKFEHGMIMSMVMEIVAWWLWPGDCGKCMHILFLTLYLHGIILVTADGHRWWPLPSLILPSGGSWSRSCYNPEWEPHGNNGTLTADCKTCNWDPDVGPTSKTSSIDINLCAPGAPVSNEWVFLTRELNRWLAYFWIDSQPETYTWDSIHVFPFINPYAKTNPMCQYQLPASI